MDGVEPSVQEANKALVRQYLEEIYRGNYDILVQLGGDNSIDRPYGLSAKPVGAF